MCGVQRGLELLVGLGEVCSCGDTGDLRLIKKTFPRAQRSAAQASALPALWARGVAVGRLRVTGSLLLARRYTEKKEELA
jgi:hypothetical protein